VGSTVQINRADWKVRHSRFVQVVSCLILGGLLLMFFCPLPTGSFQTTHGPTAAMRSLRNAQMLKLSIARAVSAMAGPVAASAALLFGPVSRARDAQPAVATDPILITCDFRC
jgi:hypothetical protein